MQIMTSKNLDFFSLVSLCFLAFSLIFSGANDPDAPVGPIKIADGAEINSPAISSGGSSFREYFSSKFSQQRFGREVTIGKSEIAGFQLLVDEGPESLLVESGKDYLLVETGGSSPSAYILFTQALPNELVAQPSLGAANYQLVNVNYSNESGLGNHFVRDGGKTISVNQEQGVGTSDKLFLVEASPRYLTVVHDGVLYELGKSDHRIRKLF